MNRRTPEQIETFTKDVAKALGNNKAGKSMTELVEALGGAVDKTYLRRALLAIGAESLGNTRAARWFSKSAVAKYGRDALNPQAAA